MPFLDGLRGLSALYVAVFHAFQMGGIVQIDDHLDGGVIDKLIKASYYVVFSYGYCAVTIFIVLSGYSLMLPVARSRDGRMPKGVLEYLRRRARRIMPPYYAALALSLALIAVVPGMNTPGDSWWSGALPAFDTGAIVSHLLLVHNWSKAWIGKIDTPMWSVAVEWQIYLILPTILLPVRRRWGSPAMLATGLVLGLLPKILFPSHFFGERYIAMFSIGAFAACVGFADEPFMVSLRGRLPWRAIQAGAATAFALLMLAAFRFWKRTPHMTWFYVDRYSSEELKDLVVAVWAAASMILYAESEKTGKLLDGAPLLRALHTRWSMLLGHFSYSLYLTHGPILTVVALACLYAGMSGAASYLTLLILGLPLALGFAWAFYWFFERPFMRATPARVPALEKAAA
jgi:peptidoglycan/LPS O-acetylase OafA/YrhL